MFLYVTIGILFAYTVILIGFFMGWCTLIPTRCHSRRELPFSTVKSPRRNTKYVAIDMISSSQSCEVLRHFPEKKERKPRRWSLGNKQARAQKESRESSKTNLDDYLHPKYSLPPVSIDLIDRKWEFELLLRVPGRAVRSQPQPEALFV